MIVFPLVVTVVAFAFAFIVGRQFLARRRPYQLVWTASLTMGGLAGLFFVLFLLADRNVAFFKLYYIFGALLMAAYLGLGSVYLLAPRRAADITAAILVVVSLVGLVFVLISQVNTAVLHSSNVEAGSNAVSGPGIAFIALLNTFGAVAVIGGAIYSAWRLWRRQGPPRLLAANVLIASGTILASLAGTLARVTGNGSSFWLLLAAGFVVLFAGFLVTATAPVRRAETAPRPTTAREGAGPTSAG
jgi:hypothetical protein